MGKKLYNYLKRIYIYNYSDVNAVASSSIDAFGVETSLAPFTKQPTLYTSVLKDLQGNRKNNYNGQNKIENLLVQLRAEQLLAAD